MDILAERRQWGEAAYPGTFSEQAARKGDAAHTGSAAGEQTRRMNYAGPMTPREAALAGSGWGPSPVLSGSCPFSRLAILGPLRRPSSRCTTERDLVSDNKARQSLTGQCHFSPGAEQPKSGTPKASSLDPPRRSFAEEDSGTVPPTHSWLGQR